MTQLNKYLEGPEWMVAGFKVSQRLRLPSFHTSFIDTAFSRADFAEGLYNEYELVSNVRAMKIHASYKFWVSAAEKLAKADESVNEVTAAKLRAEEWYQLVKFRERARPLVMMLSTVGRSRDGR